MNKTWFFCQGHQRLRGKRDEVTSYRSTAGCYLSFAVLGCPFYNQHIVGTHWFLTIHYPLHFDFLLNDYLSRTGKSGETLKSKCPHPSAYQQPAPGPKLEPRSLPVFGILKRGLKDRKKFPRSDRRSLILGKGTDNPIEWLLDLSYPHLHQFRSISESCHPSWELTEILLINPHCPTRKKTWKIPLVKHGFVGASLKSERPVRRPQ